MATPPPEACTYPDCQQIPVLDFDGQRYSTGTIAASASLHGFSFVGGIIQGTYSAGSGSAVINGSGKQATCSGDRLTLNGIVFERACAPLERALDASAASAWGSQRTELCAP